ncbi:pleckstrin homology domain-containing family f member 2 [Anaeramoeba flamelloides]|uniref:Pleckstrin homology domain-containing family f member 2 n=1 Tax=Anaeramoeba flamelloides TaxID=1746091 RepID=A0ABQ8YWA0_9EUKA|nr:pleckstrin homology domain-containing family f member 2 [Anaeramoeba flamelloides]
MISTKKQKIAILDVDSLIRAFHFTLPKEKSNKKNKKTHHKERNSGFDDSKFETFSSNSEDESELEQKMGYPTNETKNKTNNKKKEKEKEKEKEKDKEKDSERAKTQNKTKMKNSNYDFDSDQSFESDDYQDLSQIATFPFDQSLTQLSQRGTHLILTYMGSTVILTFTIGGNTIANKIPIKTSNDPIIKTLLFSQQHTNNTNKKKNQKENEFILLIHKSNSIRFVCLNSRHVTQKLKLSNDDKLMSVNQYLNYLLFLYSTNKFVLLPLSQIFKIFEKSVQSKTHLEIDLQSLNWITFRSTLKQKINDLFLYYAQDNLFKFVSLGKEPTISKIESNLDLNQQDSRKTKNNKKTEKKRMKSKIKNKKETKTKKKKKRGFFSKITSFIPFLSDSEESKTYSDFNSETETETESESAFENKKNYNNVNNHRPYNLTEIWYTNKEKMEYKSFKLGPFNKYVLCQDQKGCVSLLLKRNYQILQKWENHSYTDYNFYYGGNSNSNTNTNNNNNNNSNINNNNNNNNENGNDKNLKDPIYVLLYEQQKNFLIIYDLSIHKACKIKLSIGTKIIFSKQFLCYFLQKPNILQILHITTSKNSKRLVPISREISTRDHELYQIIIKFLNSNKGDLLLNEKEILKLFSKFNTLKICIKSLNYLIENFFDEINENFLLSCIKIIISSILGLTINDSSEEILIPESNRSFFKNQKKTINFVNNDQNDRKLLFKNNEDIDSDNDNDNNGNSNGGGNYSDEGDTINNNNNNENNNNNNNKNMNNNNNNNNMNNNNNNNNKNTKKNKNNNNTALDLYILRFEKITRAFIVIKQIFIKNQLPIQNDLFKFQLFLKVLDISTGISKIRAGSTNGELTSLSHYLFDIFFIEDTDPQLVKHIFDLLKLKQTNLIELFFLWFFNTSIKKIIIKQVIIKFFISPLIINNINYFQRRLYEISLKTVSPESSLVLINWFISLSEETNKKKLNHFLQKLIYKLQKTSLICRHLDSMDSYKNKISISSLETNKSHNLTMIIAFSELKLENYGLETIKLNFDINNKEHQLSNEKIFVIKEKYPKFSHPDRINYTKAWICCSYWLNNQKELPLLSQGMDYLKRVWNKKIKGGVAVIIWNNCITPYLKSLFENIQYKYSPIIKNEKQTIKVNPKNFQQITTFLNIAKEFISNISISYLKYDITLKNSKNKLNLKDDELDLDNNCILEDGEKKTKNKHQNRYTHKNASFPPFNEFLNFEKEYVKIEKISQKNSKYIHLKKILKTVQIILEILEILLNLQFQNCDLQMLFQPELQSFLQNFKIQPFKKMLFDNTLNKNNKKFWIKFIIELYDFKMKDFATRFSKFCKFSDQLVQIKWVVHLYLNNKDLIAEEEMKSVSDNHSLGLELLKVAEMRLTRLVSKLNNEQIIELLSRIDSDIYQMLLKKNVHDQQELNDDDIILKDKHYLPKIMSILFRIFDLFPKNSQHFIFAKQLFEISKQLVNILNF